MDRKEMANKTPRHRPILPGDEVAEDPSSEYLEHLYDSDDAEEIVEEDYRWIRGIPPEYWRPTPPGMYWSDDVLLSTVRRPFDTERKDKPTVKATSDLYD